MGHAKKRVGTALGKLKKEKKSMAGRGKLSDTITDRLQNYHIIYYSPQQCRPGLKGNSSQSSRLINGKKSAPSLP